MEKTKTKKERKKRDEFNFENFEYIDFSKDVSNNINLKNEDNRSIELLPPRYPQLEKCPSHNFSIDIFDVNGDIIGKKYDYLLNSHLTSSNMLVDELTPEDFTDDEDEDDDNDNDNVNYVNTKNQKDEILASSNYCVNDYTDDFNDCDVFSPFAESGYETIGDTLSSRGNSFNESIRGDDDDDHILIRSPSTIQLNSRDFKTEMNNLNEKTVSNNETILTEATTSALNLLKNSKTRESFETDAGYTSGDPDDANQTSPKIINNSDNMESQFQQSITDSQTEDRIQQNIKIKELSEKKCDDNLRRSKRQKNKIVISFEPFPVTEIPDVTQKNISSKLKTIIQLTKKRKSTGKNIKCKKFKEHTDNLDDNKLNIKNKNNQLSTYKLCEKIKKEIKEYEKLLKEKYNDLYDAVGSDDLLGFKRRIIESENIKNKNYSPEKNQSSTLDDPGGDTFFKTPEVPCLDDPTTQEFIDTTISKKDHRSPSPEASCSYTPPPPLPDYDDNSDQSDDPGPDEYPDITLNYEKQIELKMKALQDDFDSSNDRVNETSRWLKTMEVLKIAERRPIFHVHEYENRIIKNLKLSHENCLSFDNIVATEDPEDIARLFLASLHLVINIFIIYLINFND